MQYSFWNRLKDELSHNRQLKIKVFIVLFRLAQLRRVNAILNICLFPMHALYHVYSHFILNIELPINCKIEAPLIIWHGTGVVLNPNVVIGSHCIIRNGVTIGNDGKSDECPTLACNVEIGANAVIVGNIKIGENTKIGPCSFVNFDVVASAKIISTTKIKQ